MEDFAGRKVALITGITGQDGAYLASFLLGKGYIVHGLKRRSSMINTSRIDHLYQPPSLDNRDFTLHYGDLSDSTNIIRIIQEIQPDEIYNLASQSHVKVSFSMPEYTVNTDGLGILRILDAVRLLQLQHKTKIYQASSAKLYGESSSELTEVNEGSFFYPKSPYAVAKLYGYWITVNYREAYNMFACNGISFNHESPLRGETFVTRKITQAIAKIALGKQSRIYLGDLSAICDWGHAKDYVEAMWLILQQEKPADFVIATGVTTSVREFVRLSFEKLGIEVLFSGKGEQEKGVIVDQDESRLIELGIDPELIKMGQTVVKIDPQYYRPTTTDILAADTTKVNKQLKWKPQYDLDMLVSEMVLHDLKIMQEKVSCNNLG